MIKILLGIFFIFIGLFILIRNVVIRTKGVKINAVISGYSKLDSQNISPMLSFEYNGEKLNLQASDSFKKEKYPVNSNVEIYYHQGDENPIIAGEKREILTGIALIFAGALIMVLMLIR